MFQLRTNALAKSPNAVKDLADVIKRKTIVVIVSTVLPGTVREKILPVSNPFMKICYNPFFIAMGTTMRDYLYPEFVLFALGLSRIQCGLEVSVIETHNHIALADRITLIEG